MESVGACELADLAGLELIFSSFFSEEIQLLGRQESVLQS